MEELFKSILARYGLSTDVAGTPYATAALAIGTLHLHDQASELQHSRWYPGEGLDMRVTSSLENDARASLIRPSYTIVVSSGLVSRFAAAARIVSQDPGLSGAVELVPNPPAFESTMHQALVPFNIPLFRDTLDHILLHEYAHIVRGHLQHHRQFSRLDTPLNGAPIHMDSVEAGFRRFYELDADVVAAFRIVDWLIPAETSLGLGVSVRRRAVHLLFALGIVMLELDTYRTPLERPLAYPSPHPVIRMMLVQGVFGAALC